MGVHHPSRLQPGNHALEGVLEVGVSHEVALMAAREDRGLVGEVGEIGAGEAGGVTRDPLEVDVLCQRLAAGVDLEDLAATGHVGRRHEHLAVEAPGPKQRPVELLEQVRGGHHDDVVA